MFRLMQTHSTGGRVQAYVDSYILTENAKLGSVKYLSMFGGSHSVKALVAQIIKNDGPGLVTDDNQFVVGTNGTPIDITRGYQRVRVVTRQLKPGITHKVVYSEEHFKPWDHDADEFVTFGATVDDAKKRAFDVIDKVTTVPIKTAWTDWLWEVVTDVDLPPIFVGGNDPNLKYADILRLPNSSWFEKKIKESLDTLRAVNG